MSAAAYSLLHPGVQKAIFRQGWSELHRIQVDAINVLLAGTGHLLICAQTAGGKTEAAFLPIISRLAKNPRPSVQALNVGPLVALINDQFSRLETLCADVEVPVHRWHGAASATEKRRLRDAPGGILLITPESLESNFINYGVHLRRIYAELDFIVIDELHSFLSNVRGVHLRSLLARLSAATGRKPRIIGLSATLGDPHGARTFLAPDAPDTVSIIQGTGEQAVRFCIKGYLRGEETKGEKVRRWHPNSALSAAAALTPEQAREPQPLRALKESEETAQKTVPGELEDIAADLLRTCADGTNLVFGNAKQDLEILADILHRCVSERHLPHDPFHVHHGSLSKDVREETEAILKSGRPATVLCSSTLEMGIDIGSVRRVAQLDPPWSVASMRQRLGRSGRRAGEAAVMRVYVRDESPNAESKLTALLFPKLLRDIALARLMFAKWLEPHDDERLDLSTLVHQILSCLRETGGRPIGALFAVLVKNGAFRNVSEAMFRGVLRSLGGKQLIEQMPTGELILAPSGERITAERDFYAAFASSEEFIVRHDTHEIGKLQSSLVPPVGENLILAGRRWVAVLIDPIAKAVWVQPTKGGKAPIFLGTAGEIHTRIVEEMAATLAAEDVPLYLDEAARTLLQAARATATRAGVLTPGFIIRAGTVQWFPWIGTRGLLTLELHARCAEIEAERDALSITYKKTDSAGWRTHMESIARGGHTALDLARRMTVKTFEKFDETLAEELLDEANARDRLDLAGAKLRAEQALSTLTRPAQS
ncbi:MAG: DEAD/DEAH box helicase [Chthoniobacteraceae bacterium]